MSPVIGYASRQFGTAGLERTFDAQLTGFVRSDPVRDLLKKFDRSAGGLTTAPGPAQGGGR